MAISGGIRRKLWLGISALLLAQLLTAGLAVYISWHSDAAIEQTFKNNGDSLAYMHELTQSLDRLDALVRAPRVGSADAAAIRALSIQVDRNTSDELANVSEHGEREAATDLRATWKAYQAALQETLRPGPAGSRRSSLYRMRLSPEYARLQNLAWVIADLNLKNARFRSHGRDLLADELTLMILLLVAGVAVGIVFAVQLGRALVNPVLELTSSVRGLGRGRLDERVAATGEDELGELGRAFNAMARRLRELEQSLRAKLLRTQNTTQLAINSFSDPVAVLGMDHRVDLCNQAAEQLFGLSSGQGLQGGPLAEIATHLDPVLKTGRSYEPASYRNALQVQRKGRKRYILPRLIPVKDRQGRIIGATLVLADVTALRKLDEMKSSLLATISHELKNPLTSLRMAAHLLQEDLLAGRDGRQSALVATAMENAERMHDILEGLLELGRLESGDLLRLELLPAAGMLREIVASLRPPLERQGIRFDVRVPEHLPTVAVDAGRLKLVFTNLLDNAARHAPNGTITVGARLEGQGVRFWVEDEGPGVPKEHQGRIFERFFRAPGQSQGTGLGLGLAIAREITELHGGNLALEPSSRGARFTFLLPLAKSTFLSVTP